MDGFHALSGLRRQRRDAIAIVGGQSFQIGGGSRATGRIESGNRQDDRERSVMMIIQLVVPSARGTNAGHSVSRSEPAQQNVRASTCARKFFSRDPKTFRDSEDSRINY